MAPQLRGEGRGVQGEGEGQASTRSAASLPGFNGPACVCLSVLVVRPDHVLKAASASLLALGVRAVCFQVGLLRQRFQRSIEPGALQRPHPSGAGLGSAPEL